MSENQIDPVILNEFIGEQLSFEQKLFEKLVSLLSDQFREFDQLNYAGAPAVLEKLGQAAHKLKSGCRSFGAMQLALSLESLEASAKKGEAENVEQKFKAVKLSLPIVIAEIEMQAKQIFARQKSAA